MSLTGQQVGKYRIGPLIGEGGMAEVYMGEQAGGMMARRVAIKVVSREHCQNAEVVNRMKNEARALGKIRHPGVVEVFDVLTTMDGRLCIIMEFLQGKTLRGWLDERGRISVQEALFVVIQLVDALAAAHDVAIIHRDVKPDNCFVIVDQAGNVHTKLVDFGIAKLVGDGGLVQTGASAKMGTAAYMPPEQFRSPKDVDHRTDQYSVGCMLFEMLTGQTPFPAKNLVQAMQAHAYQPPPALRSLLPGASAGLEQVMNKLLAKTPFERFNNMRELKQALEVIQAGGEPNVHAPPPTGGHQPITTGAHGAAHHHTGHPGHHTGHPGHHTGHPGHHTGHGPAVQQGSGKSLALILMIVAVLVAVGAGAVIAFVI